MEFGHEKNCSAITHNYYKEDFDMFEMKENDLKGIEEIVDAPSFYPNIERKTRDERLSDMKEWFSKYNEVNEFYNVWGLDIKNAPKQDIYLDHGIFRKQRYELNSKFLCSGDTFTTNYTVIMRDKSVFESFVSQFLPDTQYVKSYAVFKGNKFIRHEKSVWGGVQQYMNLLMLTMARS